MTHEYQTSLSAPEILSRAKTFFAERVPNQAAYPEKEGATYLTLRGQGGEEIALGISPAGSGSQIRASTLFFDQALARFLSTLPPLQQAG